MDLPYNILDNKYTYIYQVNLKIQNKNHKSQFEQQNFEKIDGTKSSFVMFQLMKLILNLLMFFLL